MTTKILPVVRYVPVLIFEEGGVTACCKELGLTGSGLTEEDARTRLRQMVAAFCRALERKGLLEKTLTGSGIKIEHPQVHYEPGEDIAGGW
ncbi:MAG: hypothetical protein AAB289_11520 [Chloroflexota bacterium]